MKVRILYKNGEIRTIFTVKQVTNASTKIDNDFLYVYKYGDTKGNPSIGIPIKDILCVEVTEC